MDAFIRLIKGKRGITNNKQTVSNMVSNGQVVKPVRMFKPYVGPLNNKLRNRNINGHPLNINGNRTMFRDYGSHELVNHPLNNGGAKKVTKKRKTSVVKKIVAKKAVRCSAKTADGKRCKCKTTRGKRCQHHRK